MPVPGRKTADGGICSGRTATGAANAPPANPRDQRPCGGPPSISQPESPSPAKPKATPSTAAARINTRRPFHPRTNAAQDLLGALSQPGSKERAEGAFTCGSQRPKSVPSANGSSAAAASIADPNRAAGSRDTMRSTTAASSDGKSGRREAILGAGSRAMRTSFEYRVTDGSSVWCGAAPASKRYSVAPRP